MCRVNQPLGREPGDIESKFSWNMAVAMGVPVARVTSSVVDP